MLPYLRAREDMSEHDGRRMCMKLLERHKYHTSASPSISEDMSFTMQEYRQRANATFSAGDLELACLQYSKLIEMCPNNHLALSNRSLVYTRLEEFGNAALDACAVIRLVPTWLKGYVRLAIAKLGSYDQTGALEALAAARRIASSSDSMGQEWASSKSKWASIEVKARAMVSHQRCDARLLACWDRVVFKQTVIVVDLAGKGDFTSLRDAVKAAEAKSSTIIVLAGSYAVHWPMLITQASTKDAGLEIKPLQHHLQILGEEEGAVELLNSANSAAGCTVLASDPATSIVLENIHMRSSGRSHQGGAMPCVLARNHSTVELRNCQLSCSGTTCVGIDGEATVTMINSVVIDSATAVVVQRLGHFVARDSKFERLTRQAITVTGGSCHLARCQLRNIAMQAILTCICQDEGKLTAEDCLITECGCIQSAHAVLINDGSAVFERCRIVKNRGGGIIVQAGYGDYTQQIETLHTAIHILPCAQLPSAPVLCQS